VRQATVRAPADQTLLTRLNNLLGAEMEVQLTASDLDRALIHFNRIAGADLPFAYRLKVLLSATEISAMRDFGKVTGTRLLQLRRVSRLEYLEDVPGVSHHFFARLVYALSRVENLEELLYPENRQEIDNISEAAVPEPAWPLSVILARYLSGGGDWEIRDDDRWMEMILADEGVKESVDQLLTALLESESPTSSLEFGSAMPVLEGYIIDSSGISLQAEKSETHTYLSGTFTATIDIQDEILFNYTAVRFDPTLTFHEARPFTLNVYWDQAVAHDTSTPTSADPWDHAREAAISVLTALPRDTVQDEIHSNRLAERVSMLNDSVQFYSRVTAAISEADTEVNNLLSASDDIKPLGEELLDEFGYDDEIGQAATLTAVLENAVGDQGELEGLGGVEWWMHTLSAHAPVVPEDFAAWWDEIWSGWWEAVTDAHITGQLTANELADWDLWDEMAFWEELLGTDWEQSSEAAWIAFWERWFGPSVEGSDEEDDVEEARDQSDEEQDQQEEDEEPDEDEKRREERRRRREERRRRREARRRERRERRRRRREERRRRRRRPSGSSGSWGRGGGWPWPWLPPFPPRPAGMGDACPAVTKAPPENPSVADVRQKSETLAERTYNHAVTDLLPNDRSIAEVATKKEMVEHHIALDRNTRQIMGYEDTTAQLHEAVSMQKRVIDFAVQSPRREFMELTLATSRNEDVEPVHPLLARADAPAATRLWQVATDSRSKQRIAELAGKLKAAVPLEKADQEKAVAVYRELVDPRFSSTKVQLLNKVIVPHELEQARHLIRRIDGAKDVIADLQKTQLDVKAPARDSIRVENVAAQVLYTHVVGKEQLLAQRSKLGSRAALDLAFVKDEVLQRINYGKDNGFSELRSIRGAEPARIKLHNYQTRFARELKGTAAVAQLRSMAAPKVAQVSAETEYAARQLSATAWQGTQDLQIAKVAAQIPRYATAKQKLDLRIEEGKRISLPAARLKNLEQQSVQLGTKLDNLNQTLTQNLPNSPRLASRYTAFQSQSQKRMAELTRLTNDTNYRTAVKNKIPDARQLTLANHQTRVVQSRTAQQPPAPPPLYKATQPRTVIGGVHKREDLQKPEYLEKLFKQRVGNMGVIHRRSDLQDPDYLRQLYKNRVGGYGAVHVFNNAEEQRDWLQQRLGGLGVVHTRSDLQNPDYLAQQFKARMGGFGVVHQFKNEQQLKQFAQSRLGGLGVVHLRSDLQDPTYMANLYRSRLGGFGWVHEFKNAAELRDFVQSRIGGMGRAYTCRDLIDQGVSPQMAQGIFDNARTYGKKDFESDADYDARMLEEHPDRFTVDEASGGARQKTWQERQAERRKEMLDSGQWLVNPQTGNLVPKNSKAGSQILRNAQHQRKFQLQTEDGKTATLEISGLASLRDTLESQLSQQGFRKDANGDWIDPKTGAVVFTAERVERYDSQYNEVRGEEIPEWKKAVDYLPEDQRPQPPAPPPAQQLEELAEKAVNAFGFEIKNLKIGQATLDSLQVRPGESVEAALRRTLEGTRYRVDDYGVVVDRDTGEIVWSQTQIRELESRYRKKVQEALFGEGGLNQEVLYLAQFGTPSQKQKAQQLVRHLENRLEQMTAAAGAQTETEALIEKVTHDPNLKEFERRQQLRDLNEQLSRQTLQRREIEQNIIDNALEANRSAVDAVKSQLSYAEQDVLRHNRAMASLVTEIESIDQRLDDESLSAYHQRELRERRARKLAKLLGKQRDMHLASTDLPRGSRVSALLSPVDVNDYFDETTVMDVREARRRAHGVRFEERDGKRVAVYVNAEGAVLRGPDNREIVDPAYKGEQFQRNLVSSLARYQVVSARRRTAYDEKLSELAELDEKMAGYAPDHPYLRHLQREHARLVGDIQELADGLNFFIGARRQLEENDREALAELDERAAQLQREREHLEKAKGRGGKITWYVDENGVVHATATTAQEEAEKARREELQRQAAEAQKEVERRVAALILQAKEARDAQMAELQQRQAAHAAAVSEAQRQRQQQLTNNAATAVDQLTRAENDVAGAEQALEAARQAARRDKTPQNVARVEAAEKALREAEGEVNSQRMQAMAAMAAAASNNPQVFEDFNAQQDLIKEAADEFRRQQAALGPLQQALREAQEKQARITDPTERLAPENIAEIDALEDQLQAQYATIRSAGHRLSEAVAARELILDNAMYTGASPEYNEQRYNALKQKVNQGGGRPEQVLSTFELEEYRRRDDLARYHGDVADARRKADELRAIRQRLDTDPDTVTPAEKARLSIGLTDEESRILIGETQRHNLLTQLDFWPDQEEAAAYRSLVGQWMTDYRGGLGGASTLQSVTADTVTNQLGFLDTSEITGHQVKEYEDKVALRERELEQARQDLRDHPGDAYYLRQVGYADRLLSNAEHQLSQAQSEHRRTTRSRFHHAPQDPDQPDAHSHFNAFLNRLSTVDDKGGYLNLAMASMEKRQQEAARLAAGPGPGEPDYADNLEVFREGRDRALAHQRDVETERERRENNLETLRHKERLTQAEINYRQGVIDRDDFDALGLDEDTVERELQQFKEQLVDQQGEIRFIEGVQVRRYTQGMEEAQAMMDVLPAAWERDPQIRAAIKRERLDEAFRLEQAIQQNSQQDDVTLQAMEDRIADLTIQKAIAQSNDLEESVENFDRMISDANFAIRERREIMDRRLTALENQQREMYRRNREDDFGPAGDYDLTRRLENMDVDYRLAFTLDDDREKNAMQSGERSVTAAIDGSIADEDPGFLSLFAHELVGDDPLKTAFFMTPAGMAYASFERLRGNDPFEGTGTLALLAKPETVIKGAVGGIVGAVEHGGTMIKGLAELGYEAGDTLMEAAFVNMGFEDGWIAGTENLDWLVQAPEKAQQLWNRLDMQTVSRMAWNSLKKMEQGDATWNYAKFGGAIALEAIMAVNPAGAFTAVAKGAQTGGRFVAAGGQLLNKTTEFSRLARGLEVVGNGVELGGRGMQLAYEVALQSRIAMGRWLDETRLGTSLRKFTGRLTPDELDHMFAASFIEKQLADADRLLARAAGETDDAARDLLLRQADDLKRQAIATARNNPSVLGRDVDIVVNPDLGASSVRVHHGTDALGLTRRMQVHVGPGATVDDVAAHVPTLRSMQRYAGVTGRARELTGRMANFVRRNGQPPVGSRAWEAALEVDKLPRIIDERLSLLRRLPPDKDVARAVADDIAGLERQLAQHEALLGAMEVRPGRGFVAADSDLARFTGLQDSPIIVYRGMADGSDIFGGRHIAEVAEELVTLRPGQRVHDLSAMRTVEQAAENLATRRAAYNARRQILDDLANSPNGDQLLLDHGRDVLRTRLFERRAGRLQERQRLLNRGETEKADAINILPDSELIVQANRAMNAFKTVDKVVRPELMRIVGFDDVLLDIAAGGSKETGGLYQMRMLAEEILDSIAVGKGPHVFRIIEDHMPIKPIYEPTITATGSIIPRGRVIRQAADGVRLDGSVVQMKSYKAWEYTVKRTSRSGHVYDYQVRVLDAVESQVTSDMIRYGQMGWVDSTGILLPTKGRGLNGYFTFYIDESRLVAHHGQRAVYGFQDEATELAQKLTREINEAFETPFDIQIDIQIR